MLVCCLALKLCTLVQITTNPGGDTHDHPPQIERWQALFLFEKNKTKQKHYLDIQCALFGPTTTEEKRQRAQLKESCS